jgi:hypothetical protein
VAARAEGRGGKIALLALGCAAMFALALSLGNWLQVSPQPARRASADESRATGRVAADRAPVARVQPLRAAPPAVGEAAPGGSAPLAVFVDDMTTMERLLVEEPAMAGAVRRATFAVLKNLRVKAKACVPPATANYSVIQYDFLIKTSPDGIEVPEVRVEEIEGAPLEAGARSCLQQAVTGVHHLEKVSTEGQLGRTDQFHVKERVPIGKPPF